MNKTISINIAGFVFNIEEQAYEQLSQYLNAIRKNFGNEEERDEIMDDIELRIAELFQEKLGDTKAVITENDITEIMDILGHPEDFATEDESEATTQQSGNSTSDHEAKSSVKHLFRDTEDAVLGGVCSGLGHYFNVDPVIFRVLFVFLVIVGGSGILVYLILLIVIPEAKSTSDKIAMRGQSVNVESIKAHVTRIKNSVSDSTRNNNFRRNVRNTVNKGVKASHTAVNTFSKIAGLAFTVGGIIALTILLLVLFGYAQVLPVVGEQSWESVYTLITILYPTHYSALFTYIAVIVVTTLPLIALIAAGVKILFNISGNSKSLTWGLIIIWTMGIVILCFTGVELGMNLRNHEKVTYNVSVESDTTDVLFIDVKDDPYFSNFADPYEAWDATELIHVTNEEIILGYPSLHIIQRRDSGDFSITLIKESAGKTASDAAHKADRFQYDIDVVDNRIYLAPYYKINRDDRLRFQRPIIEIAVPYGKKVKFGSKIDRILEYMPGEYNWNQSYANTYWRSDEFGFTCIWCEANNYEYKN